MRTYRTVRFSIGIVIMCVLGAVAKFYEVKSEVEGSPYWMTDPLSARKKAVYIADAQVVKRGADLDQYGPKLVGVWMECSYCYVRTGLFSSALVVNSTDTKIRAVFDKTLLQHCMKDQWRVEIDGAVVEPGFCANGTLLDGFRSDVGVAHSIKITLNTGQEVEWICRFEKLQP